MKRELNQPSVHFFKTAVKIPADKLASLNQQMFSDTIKYLQTDDHKMFDRLVPGNYDIMNGDTTYMGALNNISGAYGLERSQECSHALDYTDYDSRPSYYDQVFERKNVLVSRHVLNETLDDIRRHDHADIKINQTDLHEPVTISQYEQLNHQSFDTTGTYARAVAQQQEFESTNLWRDNYMASVQKSKRETEMDRKLEAVASLLDFDL